MRLLIIDDDELTRLAMAFALEKAGHEVVHSALAQDGLRQLRESKFDGLLLDLEMTPTDGVQCLMAVRADERLRALPVILVSARPQREAVVRIARLGVRGLIIKSNGFIQEVVKRVGGLAAPEPCVGTPASERVQDAEKAAATPAAPASARLVGTPEPSPKSQDERLDTAGAIEELKSLKPILSRQELLDKVLSGNELKAMGPAARQVLSLTGNSGSSVDTVAKALRQDQAMSLRILKLANSSLYRRGAPVDTVAKAVARIGTDQIRQTILSMSVLERFGAAGTQGRIRADWFWEHGIATGLFASGIARARGCGNEQCDAMFTAGLLHDIGRMLFAERLGDVYAGVLEVADRLELPLEGVESRLLLINHADLTDRLLREWTFPAEMINPIAYHHLSVGNVRNVAPRALIEVTTLGLANRLAHACLLGTSGNDVLYPIEECIAALGLRKGVVAELCREVPDMTLDMRMTMLSHSSDAGTSWVEVAKGALGEGVRAELVALNRETTAAGYFLERLGVSAGVEQPNVLVVRVANASERAPLMDRVREAEKATGQSGLPVLVLAGSPGAFFGQGVLGERRVEQLVSPVRVERVLRALASLAGVSEVASRGVKAAA
ncbi:MAG TPA: response regulator [Phycisphaerales bacterium]|nr:response regulator [Phycisphaerales bacterium]